MINSDPCKLFKMANITLSPPDENILPIFPEHVKYNIICVSTSSILNTPSIPKPTETALLRITDTLLYTLNSNKFCQKILLDISSAFDTLDK